MPSAMRHPTKFGKYLLLERIAVGGMAEVFVAKAFGVEGFERLLAIKKILPTMGEDAEFIRMFVDEARIAVQLAHANIVQVLELGKHEERLYIAMEYVSGRDLRQLMERFRKRQEAMPLPQVCLIVAEVCEALDHAHRKRDAQGRPLGIQGRVRERAAAPPRLARHRRACLARARGPQRPPRGDRRGLDADAARSRRRARRSARAADHPGR